MYSLPSGLTYRPDQSSVQTVLTSGTSSHPEVGPSALAPPMDMEDGPLLATGLPGCPYQFMSHSGLAFSDGNPEFVGAPESARLLYHSPTFWVDQLGEEQAMAAAVCFQLPSVFSSLHSSVYFSSANQTVRKCGSAPGPECLILVLLSHIFQNIW